MVIRQKTLASSSLAFSDRSIDRHPPKGGIFFLSLFSFLFLFLLVEVEGQDHRKEEIKIPDIFLFIYHALSTFLLGHACDWTWAGRGKTMIEQL